MGAGSGVGAGKANGDDRCGCCAYAMVWTHVVVIKSVDMIAGSAVAVRVRAV